MWEGGGRRKKTGLKQLKIFLVFKGVGGKLFRRGCFVLWRRHPDLNWRIEVLQTSALPLGYAAFISTVKNLWSGRRDLNSRLQPWQGCTLPLSYSRSMELGF